MTTLFLPDFFAGDNDLAIALRDGINPGKVKAQEAASAVGGKAFFPVFSPGEQTADPRSYNDFNDLAHNSVLGRNGLARQARAVVDKEIVRCQLDFEQKQHQNSYKWQARDRTRAGIRP